MVEGLQNRKSREAVLQLLRSVCRDSSSIWPCGAVRVQGSGCEGTQYDEKMDHAS